jgi:circadian clock protein KaiC
MRSIGIDLAPWVERGLLQFHSARPSLCGLETHLAMILAAVVEFAPRVLVLDPLSNFLAVGSHGEVKGMLTRLIDFLKMKEITALFTSLTLAEHAAEQSEAGISSLIDCWLLVRNLEQNGERNRALYLLKSRGMAHSTQVREFLLTDDGVDLVDVCVGAGNVMTGSARRDYEARQVEEALRKKEEAARREAQMQRKRRDVEAQIEALRRQLEQEEREVMQSMQKVVEIDERAKAERDAMTRSRQQDVVTRSA